MNWLREPETEPIPGYRLVCPLGTGGFGEVWKCVAPGGVPKAIKFVYGNLNALDGDAQKAHQEKAAIERMIAIRHPFVLSTERIDVVDGELLIVMPLADKSLHDLFLEYQQQGRPGVPRELLLGMLADAAEGLDHLIEKHNLQHLDVKPKNLFLIADRVAVADFGLVKTLERTNTSGLMGGITPVYAAPETFASKISKHSDQYSLAVLYVELLTGKRPFSGKNIRQLAIQHMTEPPDLSGLPESDRAAVARALSKEPDERFPSCAAFVRALGGGGLRAEVTTAAASSGVETPGPTRRHPATTPDVDLSATQSGPTLPQKTPRPTTLADILNDGRDPYRLSMTVSFRPDEGVLRPAVVIGIGSFGRRALQQIRCRLLDRVGELNQAPCWRFLLIDCEPDAGRKPGGPSDAALLPEHTFHAPLQQVTGYRRRQLDQILEWLPREKLYSIPRSLRVDSNRALGRLALCDHYLKFSQRLRKEVQEATHPQALTDAADHTGLPVRGKTPSVYLIASATGGTGGMVLDAGHAVRRTLDKLGMTDATLTAFLFAGAPEDPSAPPAELANVFAALTELNHYADPEVTFTAQYGGPEGPFVEAHGLPFTATYLLPMSERTTDAFRDCVSHLAGYVAHDLTTPFGVGLEKLRKRAAPPGRTPFRGFGTFGVWFPRGLLLRSAARQQCLRFLKGWCGTSTGPIPAAEAVTAQIANDPRLAAEQVQAFVASQSGGADGDPVAKLTAWAAGLVESATAASRRPDGTGWAATAWDQARDAVGLDPTTEADSSFRRGRLSKALDGGVKKAVEAWQNELGEMLRPLHEMSGPRLAALDVVYSNLMAMAVQAAEAADGRLRASAEFRGRAKAEVQAALQAVDALDQQAGFTWFGNRVAKLLRTAAEKVKAFVEVRLAEDQAGAAALFYRRLYGWLDDRRRDVRTAREQLAHLSAVLESHLVLPGSDRGGRTVADLDDDGPAAGLRGSNTMRVVLPEGEDHLDRAAQSLLGRLPAGEVERLESILTRLVVEPRGGLVNAGRGSADLFRQLAAPMIEQATAFLTGLLPTEDVTAVELSAAGGRPGELGRRAASYARMAAPLAGGPAEDERTFVMVPEGDAGERYAAEVRAAVPGATTVPVRGMGADLLFCREQGWLRPADLGRLLEPCWDAYDQAATNTDANPHCRFDVSEWLPLVE
jgi:serine/threonine protein kinase